MSGVDNIVAHTLSRFPYESKHSTSRAKGQTNESFVNILAHKNDDYLPLYILVVQTEQQKEMRNINSKLSAYMTDWISGYSKKALNGIQMILYDRKYTCCKLSTYLCNICTISI